MRGYLLAVTAVGLAVGVSALAQHWLGVNDLSLVFMLAVIAVASRADAGPAALAALLSFLAYNFFFIEPRYTLYIAARHGVATVLMFLAAALLAGRMASRLASQVEALQAAQRHAAARQWLARNLAVAGTAEAVAQAGQAAFASALDAQVWIRLDMANATTPATAHGGHTVDDQGWWFLPLHTPGTSLGALGLKLADGAPVPDTAERNVARAMADDVAQALLRTRLVAELESQRIASETERMRSALLSSVSHDLRTPLASIIGAAETLESYAESMDVSDRSALLATISEEGLRLDRYIQNLLDMTRLGHGSLVLTRDWIGIDELVGSAIQRLSRLQPHARFDVRLADDVGPVSVQGPLLEQVFYNLLDNATKFAGVEHPVVVDVQRLGTLLSITVCDLGPGVPEAQRERVFEMFHSAERGDRGPRGTGLGLAICRGIVEAHGGSIALRANTPHGTCVQVEIPLETPGASP